jgi:hypothetical protein
MFKNLEGQYIMNHNFIFGEPAFYDGQQIRRMNFLNFEDGLIKTLIDGNKKLYNSYGVEYNLNNDYCRSDNFKNQHDGKHIVFAGCSNTFGVGTEYTKTWAYKTYEEISKNEKVDGYYNLGFEAATTIEVIVQVFRYIKKYGNPDLIFILLPDPDRDDQYFNIPDIYTPVMQREFYMILEQYCESHSIQLISSTWDMSFTDIWEKIKVNMSIPTETPHQFNKEPIPERDYSPILKHSETLKEFDYKTFLYDIYDYAKNNKTDLNLYVAKDDKKHYGSSIHHAWYKQMHKRYIDS